MIKSMLLFCDQSSWLLTLEKRAIFAVLEKFHSNRNGLRLPKYHVSSVSTILYYTDYSICGG